MKQFSDLPTVTNPLSGGVSENIILYMPMLVKQVSKPETQAAQMPVFKRLIAATHRAGHMMGFQRLKVVDSETKRATKNYRGQSHYCRLI